jgi:hypothetical protein
LSGDLRGGPVCGFAGSADSSSPAFFDGEHLLHI